MSELPKGWVEVKLPEFAELVMGQSPASSDCNDIGEGLPFFQGKAEFRKLYPEVRKFCTKPKKLAKKNDILLSVRAPVGPTNLASEECVIGRGLAAIRAFEQEENYLLHYFRAIEPWMSQQGTGSTFKAISGQFLKELKVSVAPLAEQTRIVEKLDEVLAQVDTIKARLDGIPALLKRFRQSVLASAVSGKLIGTDLALWKNEKVDALLNVVNGKAFPSKDYQTEGVRLLRPGNLHVSGRVVWNDKNTTYLPESWACKRAELKLQGGALLMNLTAQSLADDFLGRVCIFDEIDETVLLNQRICSFESKTNYDILPYMFVYFRSPQFREYVATLDSGTLIKHLNIKDIKTLEISLPPQGEQQEIVRLVDQYFAFADTIEAQVKKAQARVDYLTQSILAKAFRGELVPQDPNDEPADKLLERIALARKEAEALAKAAKKTVKKTRKVVVNG